MITIRFKMGWWTGGAWVDGTIKYTAQPKPKLGRALLSGSDPVHPPTSSASQG